MSDYYYYNPYTGYGYKFSEHARLRIWERFKTLDIEREFKIFHNFMVSETVDSILQDLEIETEIAIKNCSTNKVYIIVLTDNLDILLKTVYRDSYDWRFRPNDGSTMYKVYKDGTLKKWKESLESPFHW